VSGGGQSTKTARARIAESGLLALAYPDCERGLGAIIQAPGDPRLIEGVRVRPFPVFPDDRGYFLEVARLGQELAADFLPAAQVSFAFSYPGTIKAFHFHLRQRDCWTPAAGMFQVALVDLREDSPTFGARNTFYVGTLRPWQILIPPGVGHGYKVIGTEPAALVYLTDRFYDPEDEGRLAFDDPRIQYDWEIQHK
jgi:dTDP-4-dehydrorhamnose 3,5-epimerase